MALPAFTFVLDFIALSFLLTSIDAAYPMPALV
jgi:hypothetical protein